MQTILMPNNLLHPDLEAAIRREAEEKYPVEMIASEHKNSRTGEQYAYDRYEFVRNAYISAATQWAGKVSEAWDKAWWVGYYCKSPDDKNPKAKAEYHKSLTDKTKER